MELIALAIAPGLAICLFIFHRDAYNREPKLTLLISFLLGAAAIVPAYFIERSFHIYPDHSITGTAVSAFLIVALTEELAKFAVLWFYAYSRKSFDEPLDGIVYAVMISMGFATLENILYVTSAAQTGQGYPVAFIRMFLAVPAHATFAVLMGYYVGKAKFDARQQIPLLFTGLGYAVLFHGAYDFCLFLQQSPAAKAYVSNGLLFLGAVASFIIAIRLSFKHIKEHRRLSQQTFNPTESLSLRRAFQHDIPLVQDLADKIWPETYSSILPPDQIDYMLKLLYSTEALNRQMQQGHEFMILYDGVEPIGFASIAVFEPQVFKLHKLYILSSYQGKGTGKFVMQKLMQLIKRKGAISLLANVNRHNPAKEFYEKLGFSVIREEDIDIGEGYFMNDYVMEIKLTE